MALMTQAIRAASADGVLEPVMADLGERFGTPYEVALAATKAHRYVAEMHQIAESQAAAGLTPSLFASFAAVWAKAASAGENHAVRSLPLGHDDAVIKLWRRDRKSVPAVVNRPVTDPVWVAVEEAARGGCPPVGHLTTLLAELAVTGDRESGHAALAVLAEWPRVVVRLDENARRAWWHQRPQASPAEHVVTRAAAGAFGAPLAVALASTHGDGRVRERAVTAMLAAPSVELMPFLVLRTSDWVRSVRDHARAGLALLLADDPVRYLGAVLPVTTAIDQRYRGAFAVAQVKAAFSTASPEDRRSLAASSHPASRRFCCDLGLSWGWFSPDELIDLAESGPDVPIRARAAEMACRDAVWRRRVAVLRRLARSRRPEVRAAALTGLSPTGDDADVVAHLDDAAPLARALARDAARRAGVDAVAWYRSAVLDKPTPPVIAGFAETVSAQESALLNPLLDHPEATVRAAAVRALRQLDAVDAARVAPMLHDPSTRVVREAVTALRPIVKLVEAELLWQLLTDARTALRRGGYRLLTAGTVSTCLRAGLIAAIDPDPKLAARARADITRLARDVTASTWRSGVTPESVITTHQRTDLTTLLQHATPALEPDTVDRLTSWLHATATA
ncbi:DUF1932 domain-containing protein [Actinoplanes sp. OR16]|uniref:DUF1932 domain-containing protein n=1 Tax=Actinoplanes sp. OR16 TaxID=946334 RepID=UPI0018D59BDB|nr:DUF1932 domain-containing protein [Actinoplanes sp. OR16]